MMNEHLDRRHFLSIGLVAAGAALVGANNGWFGGHAMSTNVDAPRWSDPATWGGMVPTRDEWVSIDRAVLLDVDAEVAGLAIQPGGALVFDPLTSRTLTSTANIVVMGLLQMRPASAAVDHVVRFTGIDEARFVGGGMSVRDTDVGLWCLDRGVLDLAGTQRRAWARAAGSLPVGAHSVTLQAEPVGWQVGDELAIAPSLGPEHSNHHDAYDYATVTSISGSTVSLSKPTKFAHPAPDVGRGVVVGPEVLNLTRNVRIEGTAAGRAHMMFVHSAVPQHLSYFGTRWMAPRQLTGESNFTASVLGRYALHFHMAGEASRGSQIVGGVVRDAGGHAFVAHASHGISFISCVSHNTFEDAYWYDGMVDTRTPGADTNEVSYDSCVASRVQSDPTHRGFRLTGFTLGAGSGNRAVDCVAVGVQGNRDSSGFHWPEGPTNGIWQFQRCIAHNNRCNGIFTWQNSGSSHVVEDFVCYHNGTAGVAHGAYLTSYVYRNGHLFRNGQSAIDLHANSHGHAPQRFVGLHCEALPGTSYAVRVLKHTLEPGSPSEFVGCTFDGQRKAALAMVYANEDGATTRELFDIVDCTSTSPMLRLRDDTRPSSVIRLQSSEEVVAAGPIGSSGLFRPEWNAMVTSIERFSDAAAGHETTTPVPVSSGGVLGDSAPAVPPGWSDPAPTTEPVPTPVPPGPTTTTSSTSTTSTVPVTEPTTPATTTTSPSSPVPVTSTTAPAATTTTSSTTTTTVLTPSGGAKSKGKAERIPGGKPGGKEKQR